MPTFKCRNSQLFDDAGEPLCDYEAKTRWLGRCPGCGRFRNIIKYDLDAARRGRRTLASAPEVEDTPRVSTGIDSVDKLLIGGIPEGATVIISGPAGAGKTTFNLIVSDAVAAQNKRGVLYASAEETEALLFEKAKRNNIASPNVEVMASEGNLHRIMLRAAELRPALLVIDSIQEVYFGHGMAAGQQLVEALRYIKKVCAKEKIACLIVSHVSRGTGDVRGPTTMDHIVDGMLELDPPRDLGRTEGDDIARKGYRRLKLAMKSRIGPSGACYFNITDDGVIVPIDEDTFHGKKKKRSFVVDEGPPRPRPDWTKSRLRVVSDEATKPDGEA